MMMNRAITVLAVAFFIAMAFQTFQLLSEYSNLQTALTGQQATFEQALQVSQETQAFAGDTAALADKGNANAKQVVDQMRAQGINMRAPAAPASPPAAKP
jgi:hypothetical protein